MVYADPKVLRESKTGGRRHKEQKAENQGQRAKAAAGFGRGIAVPSPPANESGSSLRSPAGFEAPKSITLVSAPRTMSSDNTRLLILKCWLDVLGWKW